ncbi:hypothetical protein BH09BAC4_BH09BAC4_14030 [soil metagenome]
MINNEEHLPRTLNNYQQHLDKLKQRFSSGQSSLATEKANTIQKDINDAYNAYMAYKNKNGGPHPDYIFSHMIGNVPNLLNELDAMLLYLVD